MTEPLVSVLIPAYNAEAYIREAVESVLTQTHRNLEVVVVNDGSTDGTAEAVERIEDARVRLAHNDGNKGISFTRNHLLDLARGDYLAILDSDEVARPQRIAHQVAFLERHAEVDLVGSWAREIGDDGTPTGKVKRRPQIPEEIDFWLLFRCAALQYTWLGRASVMQAHRYNPDFQICDDHDYLTRIAEDGGRFANLPEPLVDHRVHGGQTTTAKAERIAVEQHAIVGRRLEAAGIAFDDDDLERHFLLAHQKSRRHAPDVAYLDWAEDWLLRLRTRMPRAGDRWDERKSRGAVARICAEFWWVTCWRARVRVGLPTAMTRFAASPLARPIWRSVPARLALLRG